MKKAPASQKQLPSARAQAHALLTNILRERHTVDEALARTPLVGAESDQRFAMLLLLSTLQHLGQVDAVLAKFLAKPLPAKRLAITNALRLGVVQLLLLDTQAHAAVNETVALVKKGKDAGLSGLVNAVLQKIAREKPALPAAIHNLPTWLRMRWEKHYGAQTTAQMAEIATHRTPLDVHSTTEMAGAIPLNDQMQRFIGEHPPVEQLAGYAEGAFFVQDVAASFPAQLLGEVKGLRVLDVCAAPGGKAAQLAQAGASVTALDRSPTRMAVLRENMARLRCTVETIVADALEWQPAEAFDAILLDAPCTATGTWRRHPEMPHILAPEEIAEMVALQRALLLRAWGWLKEGGRLVYCVCSLEPEEGEAQAQWFMQQVAARQVREFPPLSGEALADYQKLINTEGYLRTLPANLAEHGGMDGFFAAAFVKMHAP